MTSTRTIEAYRELANVCESISDDLRCGRIKDAVETASAVDRILRAIYICETDDAVAEAVAAAKEDK